MKIEIKILDKEFYQTGNLLLTNPSKTEYKLPSYATPGAAAMDLICTKDVTLMPGERKLIPTGLAIWIGSEKNKPKYHSPTYRDILDCQDIAGIILPRSGLGTKGLVLANTVGLIDEDYKSELMVSAWNSNNSRIEEVYLTSNPDELPQYREVGSEITLKAGERFAQIMFIPVVKAQWNVVEEFSDPTITRAGFGSTGV